MKLGLVALLFLILASCASQYIEPAPVMPPLAEQKRIEPEPTPVQLPRPSMSMAQRSCETTRGTWQNETCTCLSMDKLNGLSCTFNWEKIDRDRVFTNLTAYCAQFSHARTDRYCPTYCKFGPDNACFPELEWEPALKRRARINESLLFTNKTAYCHQFNETDCVWQGAYCKYEDSQCEQRIDPEQVACTRAGGNWTMFYNGCADYCIHKSSPGEISVCTANVPWSCECGPEKCWTGKHCRQHVWVIHR